MSFAADDIHFFDLLRLTEAIFLKYRLGVRGE